MQVGKTWKDHLGVALKYCLLGLGLYFFGRVIRNNVYFPLIAPVEATDPGLFMGLRYLGHLIFVALLAVYFFLCRDERFCLRALKGASLGKGALLMAGGLVLGFLMNGACILVAYLHGDIDMVWQGADAGILAFVLVAVFVQSSTEELQYRLWSFVGIRRYAPVVYAVIGSAFAFAYSHCLNGGITPLAFLSIALVGVLYALSVEYFGNIWFCCGHHTMWNFTQNCIFGLPNSGNPAPLSLMAPTYANSSVVYDATFGVEGTIVALAVNGIAIAVFAVLIYRRKRAGKPAPLAVECSNDLNLRAFSLR